MGKYEKESQDVSMHLEVERLSFILKKIQKELVERISKKDVFKEQMRTINKDMWEEVGALSGELTMDAIPTYMQDIGLLRRNIDDAQKNDKKIKMLLRQQNSPYFSRIDFKKDGDKEANSYYIGMCGFYEQDKIEIMIYDWRAPVSSMFYEFEPGRASYVSPSGIIEGGLSLKRQYRIEKGQLKLMFDSTIAIEDNILQDILAENVSTGMKTIVNTIQREQNKAIRYEGKRLVAVQGPAGSGKTSIALHRAAYLLYHNRGKISADNICLYTPNGAFAKYISTVLPELGEDDLKYETLTKLAGRILGGYFNRYETYADMMEYRLIHKNTALESFALRTQCINFKSSTDYIAIIEKLAEIIEQNIMNRFKDIVIGNPDNGGIVFAARDELEGLFYKSFRYMPVDKRLSRMEGRITSRIKDYEKIRLKEKMKELSEGNEYLETTDIKVLSRQMLAKELENVKNDVREIHSLDIVRLYCSLFKDNKIWDVCVRGNNLSKKARRFTAKTLENGILYYEDQAAILYLMILLGATDPDSQIKHIIIDEAQDYSPIAYKLFSRFYPDCGATLVGDEYQNINPISGIGNLQAAAKIMSPESCDYVKLDKSYRSTVEIMEFATRLVKSDVVSFGRSRKTPEIMTSDSIGGVFDSVANCILSMQSEGYGSIAVILRTLSDCAKIKGYLDRKFGKNVAVNLVNNDDDEIPLGVVVIPSYLTKGLEYDAVVAVVLSGNDYAAGEDQLFYTVCTRALHRLEVCSIENAGIIKRFKS